MKEVQVLVDGRSVGGLEGVVLDGDEVWLPMDPYCSCIGAETRLVDGRRVICRGDICVPFEGGTGQRVMDGGDLCVLMSLVNENLGLSGEFDGVRGELRVHTLSPRPSGWRVGGSAPDFTLPDLAGQPVSVADYRGRKVVFYVWASW